MQDQVWDVTDYSVRYCVPDVPGSSRNLQLGTRHLPLETFVIGTLAYLIVITSFGWWCAT